MSNEPIVYKVINVQSLLREYKRSRTFTQTQEPALDQRAEVERIARAVQEVDEKVAVGLRWLELAKKERAEKVFIRRLFSSRKAEKYLTRFIQDHNTYKAKLQEFASHLEKAIDFPPNSPRVQKSLLKELERARRNCQLKGPK